MSLKFEEMYCEFTPHHLFRITTDHSLAVRVIDVMHRSALQTFAHPLSGFLFCEAMREKQMR